MKVKMILPALTEATGPFWRPIKYSLFPPLGLATLAGYPGDDDEVEIQDEHVEQLDVDDTPDLVVIQVYITSAYRAYRLADHYRRRGAYVALGGLHVTSLPDEAARHADTIFLGPGEDTWPHSSPISGSGCPKPVYQSQARTLADVPPIRRDLIKRHLYLVPNSIVVSRGCPHVCDFCYKEAFFEGGRSFYTKRSTPRLPRSIACPAVISIFSTTICSAIPDSRRRCSTACAGWDDCGRRQAPSTPCSRPAARAGRGIGLTEPLRRLRNAQSRQLIEQRKYQNMRRDYGAAIRRLHDLGVMINGSFVFGMDGDDGSVFERTVEWAIEQGIETATFHILTPYPGTALYRRMAAADRLSDSRLGRLRYAACRLPPREDVGGGARTRLLASLSRLLSLGIDCARSARARRCPRRSAPCRICSRVEKVRAALGCRDPREARRDDAAGARDDSERVRRSFTQAPG